MSPTPASPRADALTVTILGAGGAMGRRVTRALRDHGVHTLRFVEPSEHGRALMHEQFGTEATDAAEAVPGSDVVVLAVPDRIVGQVADDLVPRLDPGASILCLDPAAAAAGRIPRRDDINVFVVHPTHPPLYDLMAEPDPAARRDFWGGGLAHQALVFAQAWGDESRSSTVSALAAAMFAPVHRVHSVTVDQMALLEPAMSESVVISTLTVIRETMERVIAAGVPEAATKDFMMGHLQIGISLVFEELDWKLSEGAQLAAKEAREILFKDDWHRILDPAEVQRSVVAITGG